MEEQGNPLQEGYDEEEWSMLKIRVTLAFIVALVCGIALYLGRTPFGKFGFWLVIVIFGICSLYVIINAIKGLMHRE